MSRPSGRWWGSRWVSQLSSTPRRARSRAGADQDGAAAQRGERLVPAQVGRRDGPEALVGGDGARRARGTRAGPRRSGRRPCRAGPRTRPGRPRPGPIDAISKSSTADDAHVVSHEDVAELHVAPQQRRRRFGVREMGATPRRRRRRTPPARRPRPPSRGSRAQCSTSPASQARRSVRRRLARARRQDGAAAEARPVEAVDLGQGVDHLVVQRAWPSGVASASHPVRR